MAEQWRISVAIPRRLEARIIELRKTDKFCRMTYSELVRYLVERAIALENGDTLREKQPDMDSR